MYLVTWVCHQNPESALSISEPSGRVGFKSLTRTQPNGHTTFKSPTCARVHSSKASVESKILVKKHVFLFLKVTDST